MTKDKDDSPLEQLLDELRRILEEERIALLIGPPSRIDAAIARKLALADDIERETKNAPRTLPQLNVLRALARYNRQNSVICSAMLRHVTGALDRLRRRDLHRSYNPDGSEQNPPSQRLVGAA
jgi:hypothetical protein